MQQHHVRPRPADALWVASALLASVTAPAAGFAQTAADSDRSGAAAVEPDPPIALPPVIVTGYNLEPGVPVVPLGEVGSRNVFGPTQVRETGAREINDLVQYMPAISTRPYNGGEASAPSFSMRGLPDDGLTEYVNVLVDGVPASPMPYGWTAFSFLPVTPDRLFAVDYIRGAHSVRYSPNTVGGVLNFITLPIPEAPSVSARGTFGDYGYLSVLGSGGGTWGATGLGASYVYREGDGYRDRGGFTQHDVNLKGRQALDDQSWLAASVSYMYDEHQAPGGLTAAEYEADRFGNARPRNRFEGDRLVTDVVYHRDLESSGSVEGFVYFSETERNLDAQRPHFGAPTGFMRWTDTSYFVGVGARFEKPFTVAGIENTAYAGFRYQREWLPHYRITSEPYSGGAAALTQDQEFALDTVSFHLDDTARLTERLSVNAGVRLEWLPNVEGSDRVAGWAFDESLFAVLPGVGASYKLTEHWALFGNYFLGFRAPQVWGYGSAAAAGHGLDLEDGRSAELGTRVQALAGLGGAVTLWHNDYDDFGVYYDGTYNNLGEITAEGVDLELEWDIGRVWEPVTGLSLYGAITWQNSELGSGPYEGNDVPYAWHEKASWRVRYARWGWTATLGGTYAGESFSDEANTAAPSADGRQGINPGRVLWDARLAKQVTVRANANLELAVGASNLFDQDWYVHSRGGFFGPGLAAGPPRQIYGSLGLNITF